MIRIVAAFYQAITEGLEPLMFRSVASLRAGSKIVPVQGIPLRYIAGLIQQFRSPQPQLPGVGMIFSGLQQFGCCLGGFIGLNPGVYQLFTDTRSQIMLRVVGAELLQVDNSGCPVRCLEQGIGGVVTGPDGDFGAG